MRIKKFVISNIILSTILIIILYGISWVYINYVNDRTVKFMEYNKLPDNTVDLVVLGSSHGKYGLKLWEKNQMNLALESQGMYYNLKLLEKYEDKIKNGAKIIIPLSVFSFYEPNYSNKEIMNDNYKNYVNLLDKKNIGGTLKNSEYYLTKNFSIFYPLSRVNETIKMILDWSKIKKIYKNKMIYIENYRGEKFKENAKEHANSHVYKEKINSKYGIEYAKKILELCKKNNWEYIYIVIPCHKFYVEELEKIEKNILNKRIYSNLNAIEKNYIMLDYMKDDRFYENEEYFLNADHLNKKGAEYFTEILLKDIEKENKK